MNGRSKCAILRDIRRRIASENDIELATRDCEFKGECKGTCPKCEAEVRFLENRLEARRRAGKRVAVVAVAAGIAVSASGCDRLFDDIFPKQHNNGGEVIELAGEIEENPEIPEITEISGMVASDDG